MSKVVLDSRTGKLSRDIFSDPEIYEREMERIFARMWLLLGHESMIPEPGDYVTTTMGEDPVILCRDMSGRLHALLNTCMHRGNQVCLLNSGNTDGFTCGYHGWRYGLDGRLEAVPFLKSAYFGDLNRSKLGLVEVPCLRSYGGLIFGCWDSGSVSLDDYLGEARWYLDHLLLAQWGDGVEVIASHHSYLLRANWKILAENFAGDHYHTLFTHKSAFKLDVVSADGYDQAQAADGPFEVALPGGHGIGGVYMGERMYQQDIENAHELGLGEAELQYIAERYERIKAAVSDCPVPPYRCSHGTIFPNFSFSGRGTAIGARGLYVWHPRGPAATEARQWIVVERDAPETIRTIAVQAQAESGQIASGLFAQDDADNFERVTASTRTYRARQVPFDLSMSAQFEGKWPGQDEWSTKGLPGIVGPRFSEHAQRRMYSRWADEMGYDVK